jgi:hypothetical protein
MPLSSASQSQLQPQHALVLEHTTLTGERGEKGKWTVVQSEPGAVSKVANPGGAIKLSNSPPIQIKFFLQSIQDKPTLRKMRLDVSLTGNSLVCEQQKQEKEK